MIFLLRKLNKFKLRASELESITVSPKSKSSRLNIYKIIQVINQFKKDKKVVHKQNIKNIKSHNLKKYRRNININK